MGDLTAIGNLPAKSDGTTINRHNAALQKALEIFCERINLSEMQDEFLRLAGLATEYHDYGKANSQFQQSLTRKTASAQTLYHHVLSPLFFLDVHRNLPFEKKCLIVKAIVSHHARQRDLIKAVANQGSSFLKRKLIQIEPDLIAGFDGFQQLVNEYLDIMTDMEAVIASTEAYRTSTLLSGLLIRLDHAASGDLDVEELPITEDRSTLFKRAIGLQLRPFQQQFRDRDNLCIVADTGLGKTGLSVLWSKRKQFYVLPNRSSTNAMYETLKKVYGKDRVGLLHSTALYYCLDGYRDTDNLDEHDLSAVKDYRLTKALAKPVTICTADQLFTAVFKYPTYEKIYATLAYADVIIDEIQGFSPQQIVPMITQIKETRELGTRYLLTTATLPDIVGKRLQDIGIEVVTQDETTIDPLKRHRLSIRPLSTLCDARNEILTKFKVGKKVLVVADTVKTAQNTFNWLVTQKSLTDVEKDRIHLLHSRYIWEARWKKEADIMADCEQYPDGTYKKDESCIWVCTQLVEASLDIDFDILFTEVALIDSLVQRMGRIWRHRTRDYVGEPNIIIVGISDEDERRVSYVYEKARRDEAIEFLGMASAENNGYLLPIQKRRLVKDLYTEERLQQMQSAYIRKWKEIEDVLQAGWDFLSQAKSRELFRDVLTVDMIPGVYRDHVVAKADELKATSRNVSPEEKRAKRARILKEIQRFRVPVPVNYINKYARKNGMGRAFEVYDRMYDVVILNKAFEYDEDLGLTGEIEEVDDFDERYFGDG